VAAGSSSVGIRTSDFDYELPPDLSARPRDGLVIKVLVTMRLPGTDVHEVIQVHRRYLVELMQQWTRIKEAEAESDLNLALVVDAELFRLDAVIRWLDTAAGRITRAGSDQSNRPLKKRGNVMKHQARNEASR